MDGTDDGLEQRLNLIESEYLSFLDDANKQSVYKDKVDHMMKTEKQRCCVNINHLRKQLPERCLALLNDSTEEMIAFQRALKRLVGQLDTDVAKKHADFFIGLEGSFGSKHVTPRSLSSSHLNNIVCVEGIVTNCSLVRPKIVKSVHYCPATKKTIEKRYADMTSMQGAPTSSVYPSKDEDGNLLEMEFGLSTYKDHQTFGIQEMPEKAPPGQLPRSVDIIVDDDLVDNCKPGDRVQVIGSYRCLPGKKNGYTQGTFRTVLIANNIKPLDAESNTNLEASDLRKIKTFSRQQRGVFEMLAKSVAPSIHGHDYIKKAVLCMLLGGTEKILGNGSRIRGDINVLLIGDPSVAKSQMLRYVLHTAPRAIATTGRGSSGVGLTAAVTTDPETGERRLEAGAMVLADRGVVCIDEFDKMSDIDRTAIHEVMEQGRVTIAKAGIHAKLNARSSVLAAANPVYGRYDQYKTPMENIGLQDSLLSRFDLLFIVLDKNDQENDQMIADHVLRMHRYRGPNEPDGYAMPMGAAADLLSTENTVNEEGGDEEDNPIYEKYNALLHGKSRKKSDRIISVPFMRKYIFLAKSVKPELSHEAAVYITDEYTKLRNHEQKDEPNKARTQPITARCLETMIRLSTAHAKARLANTVTLEDAQCAVELVEFAIFKRVLEKPRKRKPKHDGDGERSDEEEEEEEEEEEIPMEESSQAEKRTKRRAGRGKGDGDSADPFAFGSDDDVSAGPSAAKKKRAALSESQGSSAPAPSITDERLGAFRASILKLFQTQHCMSLSMDQVRAHLEESHPDQPFEDSEMTAAITAMTDESQILIARDVLFLL